MVVNAQSNINDLVQDDRVHGSVYTSPVIFDLEMDRIFSRTWVYVAHASELAQPGDYKAAWIGTQPVVVTRDSDTGDILVLYNRCRHRAATVCQYEKGNASYFRCAYHGWTYNNRGDLIGVPYRQGYGPAFTYEEFGLTRVAQVANYRGFVFACLSSTSPTIEEHLGNARRYLDWLSDQAPDGTVDVSHGVLKYACAGNWKAQIENSADNYHVGFVHQTLKGVFARRGKRAEDTDESTGLYWFGNQRLVDSVVRDLGNGHTVNERASVRDLLDLARSNEDARANLLALESRFGQDEARDIVRRSSGLPFTLNVFPNLNLIGTLLRVVRPIAYNRTEIYYYTTRLAGAPEEVNAMRQREQEEYYGPSGFAAPDDLDVAAERVWAGLQAKGNEWLLMSRESATETKDANGVRTGNIIGETGLRGIYRQWKLLMTA